MHQLQAIKIAAALKKIRVDSDLIELGYCAADNYIFCNDLQVIHGLQSELGGVIEDHRDSGVGYYLLFD